MTTTQDTNASRRLGLKIARAGRRVVAGLIALEGVMLALSLAHWHHLGPAVPAAGAVVLLVALGLTTVITRDLEHATRPRLRYARKRPRVAGTRPRPGVADARQLIPACPHAGAVPVDTLEGERVAWLCPDCNRQLPATFRSLSDGYALQGVSDARP